MAIKIFEDRIEFNSYTLTANSGGFFFNGDIRAASFIAKSNMQGADSGFAAGGSTPGVSSISTIQKFSYASDSNAVNYSDTASTRTNASNQSSFTHGYSTGGSNTPSGGQISSNKFSFVTDAVSLIPTVLSTTNIGMAGQSSNTNGFSSGGIVVGFPYVFYNMIEKFPFSTDTSASDVGDLTVARGYATGISSPISGYSVGGASSSNPPGSLNYSNIIDKFPFSTNANATDVGDIGEGNRLAYGGLSSTISGYFSCFNSANTASTVQKRSFASDGNSSSVGSLVPSRTFFSAVSGTASQSSGYFAGGDNSNIIEKFPFATDSGTVDVADLSRAVNNSTGHQY